MTHPAQDHTGICLPLPSTTLNQVDPNEEAIIEEAMAILEKRFIRSHYLTNPILTRRYLTLALGRELREVFALVLLDNKHGVIGLERLFFGTIDGAIVYPREVVKCALRANAAAVILVHNHPSGHPSPSLEDERITERLVEALRLIDVRTLDHLIVAGTQIVSMAAEGLMP